MRALAMCLVLAAASAGCLRNAAFRCLSDAECGAAGICEPVGYCSLPNAGCVGTGRSYSDSAGEGLSNTCVPTGTVNPGPDAAVDAPIDMAPGGCPSGYDSINGSAHRYRRLNNLTWDEARFQCRLTSADAYLAIPDDAAELMNLTMLASPPFAIGIDDKLVEGTYVTQKGTPAMFLPWKAGGVEPDNGPPDEDCVGAVSATEIATERCGGNGLRTAVCECEP